MLKSHCFLLTQMFYWSFRVTHGLLQINNIRCLTVLLEYNNLMTSPIFLQNFILELHSHYGKNYCSIITTVAG